MGIIRVIVSFHFLFSFRFRNPRESKSRNGILRRSERLSSAKRNSLSFLHMKAATMGDALNTSITSLFRKRQSSSCSSSYQDIAFKKFAMDESFSYIPQTVPEDAVSMISTTNDDTDALKDTTVFRTPSRPVVSHSRLTRAHHFEPISTLRLQTCSCCGKRLALRKPVLRCRTCRLVVHHSCQAQVRYIGQFTNFGNWYLGLIRLIFPSF